MNTASTKILTIKKLCNSYNSKPLLSDVSFALDEGEILCLLGSSGAGKTTLLRLVAGLEQPDSGSIVYRGRNMQNIPPHKRKMGMMFQDFALFPHKNVWENIAFGLEMNNVPEKDKNDQINKMLGLVGLGGFEQRRIDELSGGEQQRVALARSLAPEPRLLLLDEPLGSLDRSLRDRLAVDIRNILKSVGVTGIFVTHDQVEAFSIADKIGVLLNGELVQFAPPEELYKHPATARTASFLGFKNIVQGTTDPESNQFLSDIGRLSYKNSDVFRNGKTTANQVITLLIRPEGAKLLPSPPPSRNCKNIISGRVISRTYLGATYKVTCKIKQTKLSFDLPLEPTPPEVGNQIHLEISQQALSVLES